jgi:hypothetical protein
MVTETSARRNATLLDFGSRAARGFALRSALALEELLRASGRSSEGRDLVGRLYTQFSEGFETRDLKAAAAVLSSQRS